MTARMTILGAAAILAGSMCGCSKESESTDTTTAKRSANEQHVEAACGQCKFDLPGKGCDLAVRFDGNAYYVDGSAIDDHGDAHAEDGMCNVVREAIVVGQVENDRFVATSVKVLPMDTQ